MKIIFSYHAKKRIYERGIKFDEIRKTIRFPDYIIKKADGKIEAFKKIGGKTLKIVYVEEGKFIKVITLFYL
jgi:hypothetical protein